jgi:hypothetical protein
MFRGIFFFYLSLISLKFCREWGGEVDSLRGIFFFVNITVSKIPGLTSLHEKSQLAVPLQIKAKTRAVLEGRVVNATYVLHLTEGEIDKTF